MSLNPNLKSRLYLQGQYVYIYPSSNSDDGGDVNTEKNLARITDNLIQNNFVIKSPKLYNNLSNYHPLELYMDQTDLKITPGCAIIDGYFLAEYANPTPGLEGSFDPTKRIIVGDPTKYVIDHRVNPIDPITFSVYQDTDYIADLAKYKYYFIDHTGDNPGLTKSEISELKSDIEEQSVHVLLLLHYNNTGNVRGDMTVRVPSVTANYDTYRENHGISIILCHGTLLDELSGPYLDLGLLVMSWNQDTGHYDVVSVVNNPVKYAYIDPSVIYTEGGITIQEWVQNYVTNQLSRLDHITYINPGDDPDTEDDNWKERELRITGNDVNVITYAQSNPVSYDDDGNIIVNEVSDPDKTYSVDQIQRRTHISSSNEISIDSYEQNNIEVVEIKDSTNRDSVKAISPLDRGSTFIGSPSDYYRYSIPDNATIEESTGTSLTGVNIKSTENNNGGSKMLARADHSHDLRYIMNSDAAESGSYFQKIGTGLSIEGFNEYNISESKGIGLSVEECARIKKDLNVTGTTETGTIKAANADITKFNQVNIYNSGSGAVLSVTDTSLNPGSTNFSVDKSGSVYMKVLSLSGSGQITGDLSFTGSNSLISFTNSNGYIGKVPNEEAQGLQIKGFKVWGAVWNDYAELFKKGNPEFDYTPGTVICKAIGKDEYVPTPERPVYNEEHELISVDTGGTVNTVVGVVSDSYGNLLGGDPNKTLEENLEEYVPIALAGRVMVKVSDEVDINEGDLLVASSAGRATLGNRGNTEILGTIIGKALESNWFNDPEDENKKAYKDKILMMVSLG